MYDNDPPTGVFFHTSFNNDGNRDPDLWQCSHTVHELNPWWGVDLGVALYVAAVNFTNRSDMGTYDISYVHGRNRGAERANNPREDAPKIHF